MKRHTDPKQISQRRWILQNYRASWFKFTLSVLLSLAVTAFQLLDPWPLKILIDSVFGTVPAPGMLEPLTGTFTLLLIVSAFYVGLYLISGLLDILDSYLTTIFTYKLNIKLQTSFFYHILHLPLETRQKVETGDYVYRLNEQADNLPSLIFSTSVALIQNTFMMLAAIIILAMLNLQMALVGAFIIPLLYVSIKFFAPRIEKKSDDIASATSEIYNQSSESIQNATLVQSFNRQEFQTQKLKSLFEDRARKNVHLSLLDSFFSYANNIATATGTAIVLVLGGYGVFNHTLTLGELIIFITYMSYLYDPLENILDCIGIYKTLLAGVKQVHEVQLERADIPETTSVGTPMTIAQGNIIFKDIYFTRGEKTILDHINLEIVPGQKVAFVGPSGSGKSTILSLLPRFNRAQSGFIYLDGQEIRELNLAQLRNQFGVVSQEPELLTGTIHENIGFATPNENLDMPDIIVAAQAANAYDFIKKLPYEFETQVGEGGSYLSGGQKQRISLARAFVKNPPILLLDEPTSALDRISTAKIIAAIKKLMVGKTVLLATHEMSLLKEMDVVYIIDEGKITKISDQTELDSYIDSMTKHGESSDLYKFS